MSSGGKKTTTTVTNDAPPEWAIPYFESNLQRADNYANQPYQPYTGQRVVGADTMNPYASNAYADQQVQQLTGDITQAYQNGVQPALMSQFQQGGAFGGTAHLQALQGAQDAYAHQLTEASTGIRAKNADAMRGEYNNLLARQQAALDANYNQYLDQRDYQANRIGLMNNTLASIRGGTASQTGPNPNYTSAT